jgi:hypothetical protein
LPSGFCNKHLIACQRQRAGDSQSNHPSSNYQNVTRHLNLFKSSGSQPADGQQDNASRQTALSEQQRSFVSQRWGTIRSSVFPQKSIACQSLQRPSNPKFHSSKP